MNWQTLAPELIFQILSKFLPGLTLPVVKPEFFPWYLGHICSSWRAVFKSSPQFWSAFVIDLDWMSAERYVERALLLTEMCIQRSQTHPLSFQFKFNGGIGFELSHCHKQVLQALMAQSTRWLNAYFYLPRTQASFLYAVKTQLPILRAFRLTYSGLNFNKDLPQFGDLIEDAPLVRRVRIIDYPAWKLNWSSITTLHLEFINEVQPELLVNFLQAIDHLEELYLGCFESTGSPPRITLPFLRCLGITMMGNLLLFETPALEELYITAFSDMSPAQYYVWVPNYVGLLHHLQKIVLFLTSIDTAVMIFQYLPDTENIDFYVTDLTILKILPLCPLARRLETMTVGVITLYDDSKLKAILHIFESWRMHSNAATGFGRFEGLKRFTLKLQKKDPMNSRREFSRGWTQEYHDRFVFEFTSLFSERGVPCSINQVRDLNEYDVAVPPFDIFGGQEADYLL
ncbi:hypothetical protein M378DRAFT_172964 [Amanita muscaria Koide BX008]|uniref:F-box domain-containing protein n=1 Tax=Amanita muscaria (strain Koide BX008) TaxID=946122 RepID=A0A0C2SQ27_AMAMK|nr:hypothetical protein M378DRAFT_172964 [Amanita muscaria Koide BX008]